MKTFTLTEEQLNYLINAATVALHLSFALDADGGVVDFRDALTHTAVAFDDEYQRKVLELTESLREQIRKTTGL